MENLLSEQRRILETLSDKKRYLYNRIDWGLQCIGILGARGTGKTTLMLQSIKERFGNSDKALYISVDSPYFQANSLFDFAKGFYQHGGEALFIDEIHKYPDWSVHIKSIYDTIPGLKVVFSGSSLLQIAKQKGDLSRRAIVYNLHGLSFREYLYFIHSAVFDTVSVKDIVENHQSLAGEICKGFRILRLFRDYLKEGYYPFFLEGATYYKLKVREAINHILEIDLPLINRIELRQISKIKKLLYLLSVSHPFVPNITKLSVATDISRPKLYEYLEHLQEARLINLVRGKGRGYEILTRPDKIYLENSNLMYAIAEEVNTGSLRELFFVNQIRNAFTSHSLLVDDIIELSGKGDFIVKSAYTFEIGGKNKGLRQISDVPDSYVVSDDIESGFGRKIPLWLFGFLY